MFASKLCVSKLCVRRRRERDGSEEADGMQNQKQEPHTKMWGKKPFPVLNRITKLAPSTSLHRTTKRRGELLRGMDPKAGEALSVSLFIYLPLYLSGYLSVCLPVFLSI